MRFNPTCLARLAILISSGLSVGLSLSLILGGSPVGASFDESQKAKGPQSQTQKAINAKLTEEQKVLHLLDRSTFGARPGDLERVMKLGWEKYLDAQIHPEHISDSIVEEKLKDIESIHLSSAELAKKIPPPQVLQQILRERGLESPNPDQNSEKAVKKDIKNGMQDDEMANDQSPAGQSNNPAANNPAANDLARRRNQILKEMGYKPQQEIVQESQQAKILRAVYSERQLQEVMTDFWFNHFNVYAQKGADRILTMSYERDAIRPNVFAKFEDLLKATARHPAMLFYLDNWTSSTPKPPDRQARRVFERPRVIMGAPGQSAAKQAKPSRPRGLNENYAREIMELHTLGVDGGYTQKDVQEVARCFTGWTIRNPRLGGDFYFNPSMHDDGEKIVLGKKIPAGGGIKDGYTVIHILATHPSTAKFIATKLARKFVSDNPSPVLVARMSETFLKSDGDIREVLRTMFRSPEFFDAENYRSKIKTPFEMTVSAVRAIGADTNGKQQFHRWIAQMGQGLFLCQPPTGYPDDSEMWVNTGALLQRMNFALSLTDNRIPGSRVDLQNLMAGVGGSKQEQIIDHFVNLVLWAQISTQSRETIDKSLNELAMAGGQPDLAKIVGLILGSPEFQRR